MPRNTAVVAIFLLLICLIGAAESKPKHKKLYKDAGDYELDEVNAVRSSRKLTRTKSAPAEYTTNNALASCVADDPDCPENEVCMECLEIQEAVGLEDFSELDDCAEVFGECSRSEVRKQCPKGSFVCLPKSVKGWFKKSRKNSKLVPLKTKDQMGKKRTTKNRHDTVK